jgi:acetyltransferase-like isoleucine patch superfamily enzyme
VATTVNLTAEPMSDEKRQLGMHWAAWVLQVLPPFVGSRIINRFLRATGARISGSVSFWGPPRIYGDMRQHLKIGEHCGFNVRCVFELEADITIEDHVSVGHEVVFRGSKPIRVGAGAWLGARSVIGAGTVVTADVPDNLMISGSRKVSLARWRQASPKTDQ